VYAHQATQGRKLLTDFDQLVQATSEMEKGKDMSITGKRKTRDPSAESPDRDDAKVVRTVPLRVYGYGKSQPPKTEVEEADDEDEP
jgi:hypothetical protein